ncbi:hypothetical protein MP228_001317 [Amoeboaphelidium protococcarum]|nr:hypothetical protein MP228_001317 [Amoeboaphelidium protococcarum]
MFRNFSLDSLPSQLSGSSLHDSEGNNDSVALGSDSDLAGKSIQHSKAVTDQLEAKRDGKSNDDKSKSDETDTKKIQFNAHVVKAGDFESEKHFYPRVLNAQIHPLVASFFTLGNERIIARYTHLNPMVNEEKLREIFNYRPQYFAWAGSDLFNVTNAEGHRQMIVIETNSCPSGQKSMPLLVDHEEYGGYGIVLEHTFKGILAQTDPQLGRLAVVYDKNVMEASGYAAVMADVMKEEVLLVEFYINDPDPPVKWVDRLMYVRDQQQQWHPVRACFRYVTQKPWNRFPIYSRTLVLNSIVSCLAGGRNKMMAARAYEFYNAELQSEGTGLQIRIPETIRKVTKSEIPLWVETMGNHAVVKNPYSNAGQGVYTITNKQELDKFMSEEHHYDKFIVQSLVGNASWSSITCSGKYYHVGLIPNKKCHIYVSDLRVMVAGSSVGEGFKPVAVYARRARKPLLKYLEDDPSISSWEMLGTNLSVKLNPENSDGSGVPQFTTEAQRLLLMDRKDFNTLGYGVDDLIDAYVQTVLSVIAIDKMCCRLMKEIKVDHVSASQEAHQQRRQSSELNVQQNGSQSGGRFGNRGSEHCLTYSDNKQNQQQHQAGDMAFGSSIMHSGECNQGSDKIRRTFDWELFEALNPDPALLDEIML